MKRLFMIETVDSIHLADKLNKAWLKKHESPPDEDQFDMLKIKIQVNTSSEKRKI